MWLCLLLPVITFSQSPKRDFKKVPVVIDQVTYDFNIISIAQDNQGYLWMATPAGLLKFDGYEFSIYRNIPGDLTSLTDNYTESIYVDHTGTTWIGTGKGLNRYDPHCDCFVRYPSTSENQTPTGFITTMTEDASGNLWIGMQEGGLFRYEREKDRFIRFLDDPADPNSLIGEVVRVLLADRQNNIWIGTGFGNYENPGGLIHFNPTTRAATRYMHEPDNTNSLIDNRVSALLEDRQGRIWVGTFQNGLHLYDPVNDEFLRMSQDSVQPDRLYPPPGHKVWQSSPFITILHQDQKGGYWIGTCGGGINYFDPVTNQVKYYSHESDRPDGISNDKLWSFLEDRSGQLWLGSLAQGGLHKLDPFSSQITRYTESNTSHVVSIRESGSAPGTFYLGTAVDGLQLLDSRTGEIIPYFEKEIEESKFGGSVVHDIYEASNGLLWLGFRVNTINREESEGARGQGGLASLDLKTGELMYYEASAKSNSDASINSVYRICEDRDGFLWIGAGQDGLFRFDRSSKAFKSFKLPVHESKAGLEIDLIEMDSGGTLWIGDSGGEGALFRYNRHDKKFEPFLQGYRPLTFLEDSHGWYWVGTERNGLLHVNPDKSICHQYTLEDGLPSNTVVGILEGTEGIFWASTTRGLSQFDPETDRFISRGLPSHRFGNAQLRASDGQLFFGGNSVLFSFYPDQVSGNQIPPELIISGLKISGAPHDPKNTSSENSGKITLAHTENDLTFEYTGIHYSDPSRNQYKYKLEPYDLNWVEAGTQRTAHYRNLDPGAYTFRVIGSNDNEVWNEEGASLQLFIKTAWWSRWWAYLLYITFFCFVAYAFYRFQLSKKLALEESERQKQLNQLKSDLYTNISHEFRTPLTVILGMTDSLESQLNGTAGLNATKSLKMIRRNGKNLLSLVNEILHLSKLESGQIPTDQVQINVLPFINYLGESFESLAREKDIDFMVFSEMDELVMDVDTRKLSGILSNLLSNAIKFTPPLGKITLHCYMENDNNLIIKVCDSGSGISQQDLPHIFNRFYQARTTGTGTEKGTGIGLAIAREMTSELGGVISVESTPGKGSIFTVSLPVTRNAPKTAPGSLNLSPEGNLPSSDDLVWKKIRSAEDQELPLALIIEDNKDVACYIIQCLTGRYNALYAPDGVAGLEMALKHIPDIVISDVMMPGKDGFEVCSTLKEDELTDHIPIIMLTARVVLQDRLSGLSRGADAYLEKPFVKEELLTRMEHLISVRRKLIKKFEGTGFSQVTQKHNTGPESKFIQKAIACIHENMSDPAFGPTQLASALALSESQVYRKLKAISGKSTAIFIRAVRLQKAKSLLRSTDLNISEIAYEVGFINLAWFSRIFKKEFGATPTAIRE